MTSSIAPQIMNLQQPKTANNTFLRKPTVNNNTFKTTTVLRVKDTFQVILVRIYLDRHCFVYTVSMTTSHFRQRWHINK